MMTLRSPLALVVLMLALALSFFVVHVEGDCGSCGMAWCTARTRAVRTRDLVRRVLGGFIARMRVVVMPLIGPVLFAPIAPNERGLQLALAPLRI